MAKFLTKYRHFLRISDGNGGIDLQTVLIVIGGLVSFLFLVFYPVPRNLPDPTIEYHVYDIVSPICEGEPIQYTIDAKITADSTIIDGVFAVINRDDFRTVFSRDLNSIAIRKRGENLPPIPVKFDVGPLPPGNYEARYSAILGGTRPAIASIPFVIEDCN